MERRLYSRKAAATKVYVFVPGQPARCHSVRDLSKGGVFIDTGPNALPERTFVQLCFLSRQTSTVTKIYRLPATVVRSTPRGAALAFGRNEVAIGGPAQQGRVS